MNCKITQSDEGTGFCPIAEEAGQKLASREKTLREILKFMERHEDSSSLCWNMAEKIRKELAK